MTMDGADRVYRHYRGVSYSIGVSMVDGRYVGAVHNSRNESRLMTMVGVDSEKATLAVLAETLNFANGGEYGRWSQSRDPRF